jgi:hypothetical protein
MSCSLVVSQSVIEPFLRSFVAIKQRRRPPRMFVEYYLYRNRVVGAE